MMIRVTVLVVMLTGALATAHPRLLEVGDSVGGSGTTEADSLRNTVRTDLNRDLRLLEEERPHYTSTIVLGAVGGALLAGALAFIGWGAAEGSRPGSYDTAIAQIIIYGIPGALVVVAAAVMIIVAVVKYFGTRNAITERDAEINEVRRRLDDLEHPRLVLPVPTVMRPSVPLFEVARF